MKTSDVVVIGGVGIDTNVYLPPGGIAENLEATFCSNRDCVGQAGGYASRAMAALGHRTALIAGVGEDAGGQMIRDLLWREGVDLTGLFIDPEGTKRSVNLMHPDGRRSTFYDGRGAMRIEPDIDACREIMRGAGAGHFNIVRWSRELLPVARELGLTISSDLQDVVEMDDAYRRPHVEQSDLLFFSCVNFDDPRPLIDHFLATGPARVVVAGLGGRGCAVGTREGTEFFGPVAMDDPGVDTNGAGDCLAMGFVSSHLLGGMSIRDSALRGQICARHICTQRSDSTRFFSRDELDEWFRKISVER